MENGGNSDREGGGARGQWRGGRGQWRGRYNNGRWGYNKRGGNNGGFRGRGGGSRGNSNEEGVEGGYRGGRGGGGRGRGFNGNGNFNDNNANGYPNAGPPPPPRRKRGDPLQTIINNVSNQWRRLLPAYDLYYCDTTPQLAEFEKKVMAVETYLEKIGFLQDAATSTKEIVGEVYYSMSYEVIVRDETLMTSWPEFEDDLLNQPDETIALWSVTAHRGVYNILVNQEPDSEDSDSGKRFATTKLQIGFSKLGPVTPLLSLKSGQLGKFITIKGAIVRTGNVRPFCRRLTFRCKVCDTEFALEQIEGRYTPPTFCKMEDCTNNNAFMFEVKENASTTIVTDSRRIRVQDILHGDIERGSVPRTMDCILFGDLAEQCTTGDAVTISGTLKMSRYQTNAGDPSVLHMFIEASSVFQHKESESSMGGHCLDFTEKDYLLVQTIFDTPDLFRLMIASLCPSIFGHELVKAGMLLCLLGGASREEGIITRRSDINMLMLGDPGIGKSQMLKVLQEVAPKAVYVCGTGSTVAGLTVTLVRDGDDYSLEAGALVMADRGICCIDEFDKMTSQHHALLEALEQQSVSVAKSGVYRTLSARCTVIAAANPVGGHYDSCKTVSENIKINPALLSRFDLIFIMLDRPDQEFDQRLIDHMAGMRKLNSSFTSQSSRAQSSAGSSKSAHPSQTNGENLFRKPLLERVKIHPGEVLDLIPHVLLRKYIAYARQYVNPKVSPEAAEVLKKFYLNLRLSHRGENSTPVTARQLESLVRLTEARAKIELREVATVDDANDILEIFGFSLSSVFDDEVHAVSALSESVLLMDSSMPSGRSKSVLSVSKKVLKGLQQLAQKQCKNIFSVDEIKAVAAAFGCRDKCDSVIATLNNEGILLKKGGKTYQLQTADY